MGFAAAAFVLAGASTAMQVAGSLQSAAAQAASAKYNAQIQERNAEISHKNAEFTSQSGEANAAQQELKTRAGVGSMKANEAAGGVNVNIGSAVDARTSATAVGQLDAMTIRSNAARQAYGYLTQESSDKAAAQLDTSQAGFDKTAGNIGAATSLLGGAGKAVGNYETWQLQNGGINSSIGDYGNEGGYVGEFPTSMAG